MLKDLQRRWQRLRRATKRAGVLVCLLIRLLDGQEIKRTVTTDRDPQIFAELAHMIELYGIKIDMILTPSLVKKGRHYVAVSIAL